MLFGAIHGKIKVTIDREACIGCDVAPALCSEVFELISNGKDAVVAKYRVNDNRQGDCTNRA